MKQHTVLEIVTNIVKTGRASGGSILDAHYQIYLFRDHIDPNLVYYVGKSGNAYNRFLDHIDEHCFFHSSVGRCLLKHAPETGKWYFEVYTLDDCKDIVLAHRATLSPDSQAFYERYGNRYDVDDAEEAFINHYRPCFNVAMNPNPTPLPERYQETSENKHIKKLESLYGL